MAPSLRQLNTDAIAEGVDFLRDLAFGYSGHSGVTKLLCADDNTLFTYLHKVFIEKLNWCANGRITPGEKAIFYLVSRLLSKLTYWNWSPKQSHILKQTNLRMTANLRHTIRVNDSQATRGFAHWEHIRQKSKGTSNSLVNRIASLSHYDQLRMAEDLLQRTISTAKSPKEWAYAQLGKAGISDKNMLAKAGLTSQSIIRIVNYLLKGPKEPYLDWSRGITQTLRQVNGLHTFTTFSTAFWGLLTMKNNVVRFGQVRNRRHYPCVLEAIAQITPLRQLLYVVETIIVAPVLQGRPIDEEALRRFKNALLDGDWHMLSPEDYSPHESEPRLDTELSEDEMELMASQHILH